MKHLMLIMAVLSAAACGARRGVKQRDHPSATTGKLIAVSTPTVAAPTQSSPWATVDHDTLQRAVLDKLPAALGTRLIGDLSQKAIDRQRHDIACLRDWAKTLTDERLREEYLDWLDYYDGEANRAQERLDAGDTTAADKAREEKEASRRLHVAAIARTLPAPPMPCPLPATKPKRELGGN